MKLLWIPQEAHGTQAPVSKFPFPEFPFVNIPWDCGIVVRDSKLASALSTKLRAVQFHQFSY